jgi:hypothetical protein
MWDFQKEQSPNCKYLCIVIMENHINIDNLLIFHFQLKERPKQNLATDQRIKDRMMLEFR